MCIYCVFKHAALVRSEDSAQYKPYTTTTACNRAYCHLHLLLPASARGGQAVRTRHTTNTACNRVCNRTYCHFHLLLPASAPRRRSSGEDSTQYNQYRVQRRCALLHPSSAACKRTRRSCGEDSTRNNQYRVQSCVLSSPSSVTCKRLRRGKGLCDRGKD